MKGIVQAAAIPSRDMADPGSALNGIADPGSISDESMEVIQISSGEGRSSDNDDSMEMVSVSDGEGPSEDENPVSDSSVPIISIRKPLPATMMQSADPSSDEEDLAPRTYPSGHSFAATRIKGRPGFLLAPPARASVATQAPMTPTPSACPFQAFVEASSPAVDDEGRHFWLQIARRLFQDPPIRKEYDIPSDSVESYEVMRLLDSEVGIPTDQFLCLFDVCVECGNVLTGYWAEDHCCAGPPAPTL
ncbi:hypothetical protein EST38_g8656 [Candolleomyces aberdarensis]|uniref:Uncharacterized protein n=1 Tax=Candolleomyces aberdarensis TaxID=2316362 RepID=A0A4Q2DE87_9AGAR|nr:hypothetical protein EST38_g8656 [Candolleomyces aberdarensis]